MRSSPLLAPPPQPAPHLHPKVRLRRQRLAGQRAQDVRGAGEAEDGGGGAQHGDRPHPEVGDHLRCERGRRRGGVERVHRIGAQLFGGGGAEEDARKLAQARSSCHAPGSLGARRPRRHGRPARSAAPRWTAQWGCPTRCRARAAACGAMRGRVLAGLVGLFERTCWPPRCNQPTDRSPARGAPVPHGARQAVRHALRHIQDADARGVGLRARARGAEHRDAAPLAGSQQRDLEGRWVGGGGHRMMRGLSTECLERAAAWSSSASASSAFSNHPLTPHPLPPLLALVSMLSMASST